MRTSTHTFRWRVSAAVTATLSLIASAGLPIAAADESPALPTPSIYFLMNKEETEAFQHDAVVKERRLADCTANADYKATPQEEMGLTNIFKPDGTWVNANENKFSPDSRMAYRFAMCWLQTGDKQWLDKSRAILDAWAGTLKRVTTQPDKNEINFNSYFMLGAASWTKDIDNWDHSAFDTMVRTVFLPNLNLTRDNNHGQFGILSEAAAATYLQDPDLMARAFWDFREHTSGEIDGWGVLPKEITRSDTSNWNGGPTKGIKGMAYTHFALLPTVEAAKLLANADVKDDLTGQGVWDTTAGQRVALAAEQAAHWVDDPSTFPYYDSNCGHLYDVSHFAYMPLVYLSIKDKTDAQSTRIAATLKNTIATHEMGFDRDLLYDLFRTTAPEMKLGEYWPKPTKEEKLACEASKGEVTTPATSETTTSSAPSDTPSTTSTPEPTPVEPAGSSESTGGSGSNAAATVLGIGAILAVLAALLNLVHAAIPGLGAAV